MKKQVFTIIFPTAGSLLLVWIFGMSQVGALAAIFLIGAIAYPILYLLIRRGFRKKLQKRGYQSAYEPTYQPEPEDYRQAAPVASSYSQKSDDVNTITDYGNQMESDIYFAMNAALGSGLYVNTVIPTDDGETITFMIHYSSSGVAPSSNKMNQLQKAADTAVRAAMKKHRCPYPCSFDFASDDAN